MSAAGRYVCIHGHFYQPPRENPWLDRVETQDSARPYHDWNERITAECYAPNAMSRILNDRDEIVRIVNNYARISFNIGPTLLSWLEMNEPEIYAAVIAADVESREYFGGHGSAIAQTYNHMILPLATPRDRRTQVKWGVRDFEHRFGRRPEGMWLGEAAVDTDSLEALAENGIRFTVLEPHQAARVRAIGEAGWEDVSGGRIDPSRAYRAKLPSGNEIALFFYDGPISRAVAFENLLSRGEYLAGRLLSAFDDSRSAAQLVHIATDGETYGHHHRHGDMALAFALDVIDGGESARLTNYAEFLESHPAEHEVEIHEGTSWSCAHGVERWRSDCGCRTGGESWWNQRWRAPLRAALDQLRDAAGEIYVRRASEFFADPWEARDAYIAVVLDRGESSIDRFFNAQQKRMLTQAERVTALELLEMQRHAMLMYTSCGWFFNELSGIETVQVIQYAARVCQLASKAAQADLETRFVSDLAKAESNFREHRDGAQIYEKWVRPSILDLDRVAGHFAVLSLFEECDDVSDVYSYRIERVASHRIDHGRTRVVLSRLKVRSCITLEERTFTTGILDLGDIHIAGGVRDDADGSIIDALSRDLARSVTSTDFPLLLKILEAHLGELRLSIRSLFRDEQRRIVGKLSRATLEEAEMAFRQLHESFVPLSKLHADLTIPLPKAIAVAAEFDLNRRLQRAVERTDVSRQQVESLLAQADSERVALDEETLYVLKRRIDHLVAQFEKNPDDLETLQTLEQLVDLVVHMKWSVDLWRAQNSYYRMHRTVLPQFRIIEERGDEHAKEWIATFERLGEDLKVRASI